jgi:hypothetical protein
MTYNDDITWILNRGAEEATAGAAKNPSVQESHSAQPERHADQTWEGWDRLGAGDERCWPAHDIRLAVSFMPFAIPGAEELRKILVKTLARSTDMANSYWDRALGELVRTDSTRLPRSNWSIMAARRTSDRAAIAEVSQSAHVHHPFVRW